MSTPAPDSRPAPGPKATATDPVSLPVADGILTGRFASSTEGALSVGRLATARPVRVGDLVDQIAGALGSLEERVHVLVECITPALRAEEPQENRRPPSDAIGGVSQLVELLSAQLARIERVDDRLRQVTARVEL